jgi:hypothetical protein
MRTARSSPDNIIIGRKGSGAGDEVDALVDDIAGVTLTALSSLPALCAPRGDLATRRSIERIVFEVSTEIAKVCQPPGMSGRIGFSPCDYAQAFLFVALNDFVEMYSISKIQQSWTCAAAVRIFVSIHYKQLTRHSTLRYVSLSPAGATHYLKS